MLEEKQTVIYTRVSSNDQKQDLQRQTEELINYCKKQKLNNVEILKDIGSGINYKKRGLRKVIKKIVEGSVARVIITFKDRLLRFGIEILEQLCHMKNVEIITLKENKNKSFEYQLAEPLQFGRNIAQICFIAKKQAFLQSFFLKFLYN